MLKSIRYKPQPQVLSDFSNSEDAGIVALNDEIALVQSVDFFPPIVDDPYEFGQIAAANALSDIYAMGAKPISALSIVCFPTELLAGEVLSSITNGAISKMEEADCALVGGHSIEDKELKYGFAVSGLVDPHKILYNNTAEIDQNIILTKPLGSGIINTALRGGLASKHAEKEFIRTMAMLNKYSAEIISKYQVSACTDVTGFGLIGHLHEMIHNTHLGCKIDFTAIKLLPEVTDYASMGLIPEGTYKNRNYFAHSIIKSEDLKPIVSDIIFDPQTSGGLLFMINRSETKALMRDMQKAGVEAMLIGKTTDAHPQKVKIVNG
jgi:selenide,water dikinase